MQSRTIEAETALQRATLAVIAEGMGFAVTALRIEEQVEGLQAVFYDLDGMSRCACAIDSHHWQSAQAVAKARAAIARIKQFSR